MELIIASNSAQLQFVLKTLANHSSFVITFELLIFPSALLLLLTNKRIKACSASLVAFMFLFERLECAAGA